MLDSVGAAVDFSDMHHPEGWFFLNRSSLKSTSHCLSPLCNSRFSPGGLCSVSAGRLFSSSVQIRTSGPTPGLRPLWSKTVSSSGRCRSQTLSQPSTKKGAWLQCWAACCWKTVQLEKEDMSHLEAGVGELQICSRNLQQSVQESLHLLNHHGGCRTDHTLFNSTGHDFLFPVDIFSISSPKVSQSYERNLSAVLPGSFFSIGFRSGSSGNTNVISGWGETRKRSGNMTFLL